ncbi:homeobox and c2h2 transcription factor [Colletotrichum truncatum]|uniref:Homeobox and c2h2 transcription factor n=1 Tax=Colletotrichum truncatum TaxID=5467 RepID=A0ACC3ZD66_COLTU|nr:homeobox and c2h2 transcription factor [Colletotrichum truncatum]KAF6797974.1 homeobox and c2h2 transcription factor [Colletotrichum truncatum]
MDKGLGTADDTNTRDVGDLTAAQEFDFLAAKLTNSSNFSLSGTDNGDAFLHDLQLIDTTSPVNGGNGLSYREDRILLDPSVTGNPTHGSISLEQPGLNEAFEDANLFFFSEALGDGDSLGHLSNKFTEEIGNKDTQTSNLSTPPKIGTRFSSKSIRILKTWLSSHNHHPYPGTSDMELLERQTGLNRQQITNWLANTRRRNRFKVPPKRPPSPAITSAASLPIAIPRGNGLAQGFDELNPLQRWQVSPPEHEPASVSAIAHAVYGLPLDPDAAANRSLTDSAPTRSVYNASSVSSVGTSQSSRSSVNSAYSHNSHASLRSVDPLSKASMKRRRRRGAAARPERRGLNPLAQAPNTYQCTFCTETFKTKHNWQRHEKSLHLSLERWECSPTGPTVADASGNLLCVFCGEANPNDEHLEKHNYIACKERAPEDRTFYRKDHLQQHLKLVHDAKFLRWPMGEWKREDEKIRSRCGFCALVMGSWTDRIDHLAEHFKDGRTMEDWHGDWGFDDRVLNMLENAVAPYLIHMERYSPWPFTTTQGVPETPPNAFELLKTEINHFATEHQSLNGRMPTNAELLYEGCCIIFGSEIVANSHLKRPTNPANSWLRDILMSSEAIVKQARVRPLKMARKSRITYLSINGKADIFDQCVMEEQLQNYVDISKMIEPDVSNEDLQREASSIVERLEAVSRKPSKIFSSFLLGLIGASTNWLIPFRQRADLPLLEHADASSFDASKQGFLNENVLESNGISRPADDAMQYSPASDIDKPINSPAENLTSSGPGSGAETDLAAQFTRSSFFVNEENCYRRLALELTRFVKITTSPRNPNRHIPTDAELQHQARWISFEDDDPWNQTPADNPDWLRDFKRDMGILEEDNAKI